MGLSLREWIDIGRYDILAEFDGKVMTAAMHARAKGMMVAHIREVYSSPITVTTEMHQEGVLSISVKLRPVV